MEYPEAADGPLSSHSAIARITIIGAGFMGSQIALQCAVQGYPVQVVDSATDALQRMRAGHALELDRRAATGALSETQRLAIIESITTTGDLAAGVVDADLVIEAAPEQLALKRRLFAKLDNLCPPQTIIATNSSSLRVSLIEDATTRPDRVLNTHFYPPVWQRPLVELMRGSVTSDETIQHVWNFARAIGLTPLLVRKESTGFVFNRVWRAIKRETLHLVDAGVASADDVDRAWMLCLGLPFGPFGLMDTVGLDVVLDIERVYAAESGDPRDAPPPLLTDKVAAGDLGVKSGRGFYHYPHPAYQDANWLRGDTDPVAVADVGARTEKGTDA